jgi:hypothetical protein
LEDIAGNERRLEKQAEYYNRRHKDMEFMKYRNNVTISIRAYQP